MNPNEPLEDAAQEPVAQRNAEIRAMSAGVHRRDDEDFELIEPMLYAQVARTHAILARMCAESAAAFAARVPK